VKYIEPVWSQFSPERVKKLDWTRPQSTSKKEALTVEGEGKTVLDLL
jgi:hypothetical protein